MLFYGLYAGSSSGVNNDILHLINNYAVTCLWSLLNVSLQKELEWKFWVDQEVEKKIRGWSGANWPFSLLLMLRESRHHHTEASAFPFCLGFCYCSVYCAVHLIGAVLRTLGKHKLSATLKNLWTCKAAAFVTACLMLKQKQKNKTTHKKKKKHFACKCHWLGCSKLHHKPLNYA